MPPPSMATLFRYWKLLKLRLAPTLFSKQLPKDPRGPHSGLLFQRRDQKYLDLHEPTQVQRTTTATTTTTTTTAAAAAAAPTTATTSPSQSPLLHHDLVTAAVKIGHIEERIGYCFENKYICMEAMKNTGPRFLIHHQGVVVELDTNKRLALLGDRALSLALCEIWYHSGNERSDYAEMESQIETREALNNTGRAMELDKHLLLFKKANGVSKLAADLEVAESFEAVIGAVYVDAGHSLDPVKAVIRKLEIDKHELLDTVTRDDGLTQGPSRKHRQDSKPEDQAQARASYYKSRHAPPYDKSLAKQPWDTKGKRFPRPKYAKNTAKFPYGRIPGFNTLKRDAPRPFFDREFAIPDQMKEKVWLRCLLTARKRGTAHPGVIRKLYSVYRSRLLQLAMVQDIQERVGDNKAMPKMEGERNDEAHYKTTPIRQRTWNRTPVQETGSSPQSDAVELEDASAESVRSSKVPESDFARDGGFKAPTAVKTEDAARQEMIHLLRSATSAASLDSSRAGLYCYDLSPEEYKLYKQSQRSQRNQRSQHYQPSNPHKYYPKEKQSDSRPPAYKSRESTTTSAFETPWESPAAQMGSRIASSSDMTRLPPSPQTPTASLLYKVVDDKVATNTAEKRGEKEGDQEGGKKEVDKKGDKKKGGRKEGE